MWLLETSVRSAMEQAIKSGAMPTAQQQIDYAARIRNGGGASAGGMSIRGGTAEISVKGVLTKSPDLFALLFGGGNMTYGDIVTALAEADASPEVENVDMIIDSPGGQFDGLFDALAAIQSVSKPVRAVITGVGASAAYAIASQADSIVAANKAARIGSVGVAVSMYADDREVTITSTNAPKKRPDVTTDEGVAMVREELDALHEIFVEAIAEGRGATVEKVNADFGQGATLLAEAALKRGMIDSVASANTTTSTASSGGNKPEAGNMDLKQLKAQHPDAYAAAVQEGIEQERDRVTAHITMGEASGDTKTAHTAIKDGSAMTATLQAAYMTAGMNRSDVARRQEDDASADAGDNANASDTQDAGDEVARLVEARLGVEV